MSAVGWRGWIRRLFFPASGRVRRCRPWLEPLEERTVPATFFVNSTGDAGSGTGNTGNLRYCITQANAASGSNAIDFSLGAGPAIITLASELDITNSVTINGGSAQITVSGGGATRVFQVASGVSATIDNLTISGGFAQFGGAIENDGTLQLNGCILTGNEAYGGDGGSSVSSGGGAGGAAAGLGGAVYNTGTLGLANCTLTANQAVGGHGGNINGNSPALEGFAGGGANGGAGGAGGSYISAGANGANGGFGGGGGGGGGTYGMNDSPAAGVGGDGGFGGGGGGGGGSVFGGAERAAGAIGTFGGAGGGAAFSEAGAGGGGAGLGGALFNNGGTVTLANSTLTNDSATGGMGGTGGNPDVSGTDGQGVGGAVFNYAAGTVSTLNTTFSGNSSSTSTPDVYGSVQAPPLTVVNTNDAGPGSLRQAILDANASGEATTIQFHIASRGVQTIALASALPALDVPVLIDGTSEPGYAGTPLVVLQGLGRATTNDGLELDAGAAGSTIQGLAIDDCYIGIFVDGADYTTIQGNYIGVAADGVTAAGNSQQGIRLEASNCTIGGTGANDGNVISANQETGLWVIGDDVFGFNASNNTIEGNRIGTNASGSRSTTSATPFRPCSFKARPARKALTMRKITSSRTTRSPGTTARAWSWTADSIGVTTGTLVQGNTIEDNTNTGVVIEGSAYNNTIGVSGDGNTISGNGGDGVLITDSGTGNVIAANHIGVDSTGEHALGNGGVGVEILNGAYSNTIGALRRRQHHFRQRRRRRADRWQLYRL